MPRILIIDDDKLVREATQILLRAKGYDVAVAENGTSGIEAIKAGTFDLAIVDLFMPDMDGLKVMEIIRQEKPTLPMIAASGFMFGGQACPAMPGFKDMAAEAGAVTTLYKPFRPHDVLCAVEQAIRPTA
jgi:CheY-like chemotaxis protein